MDSFNIPAFNSPVPGDPGWDYGGNGDGPVPGDPESYSGEKLPSFTKKVEILRALVHTESQFNTEFGNIQKLPFSEEGDIKSIDVKLMEEFKKVYSLGTSQLELFIDMLNDAGPSEQGGTDEGDEYSILYYVSLLLKGPYEEETRSITGAGTKDVSVDVFKPGPDIMGVNANYSLTNSSTPVWTGIAQDVPSDTLRKAPGFLIGLLRQSKQNCEGVYKGAVMGSGAITENTLPCIDKKNKDRMAEEEASGRNETNPVHGNLMVRDIEKIDIHKEAEEGIVGAINGYLGDKAFRLFVFRKLINYFNKSQNLAHSIGGSINRKVEQMVQNFVIPENEVEEGECAKDIERLEKTTEDVQTDMFGRTFDSIERREFELKTNGNDGENLFKLYTVKGQLGSGIDVDPDPMSG